MFLVPELWGLNGEGAFRSLLECKPLGICGCEGVSDRLFSQPRINAVSELFASLAGSGASQLKGNVRVTAEPEVWASSSDFHPKNPCSSAGFGNLQVQAINAPDSVEPRFGQLPNLIGSEFLRLPRHLTSPINSANVPNKT